MRDRVEHFTKEADSLLDVEPPGIAVMVDARTLDQLEDEIRLAARSDPGVEHAGDVRVREPRQDPSFALEAKRAGAADEREVQQLDRDLAFEATIGATRAPDRAGSALTERRFEDVRADARARQSRRRVAARVAGQLGAAREELRLLGACTGGEERRELGGEGRVIETHRRQALGAGLLRQVEQAVEQRAEPLPALGVGDDHASLPRAR